MFRDYSICVRQLIASGIVGLSLLAASSASVQAQTRDGSKFKVSVTAYQMLLPGPANPKSFSLMVGEQFESFGDVGAFVQAILSYDHVDPSIDLGSYKSLGLIVAPALFDKPWGRMLWRNKVGFGVYRGTNQLQLGSGLSLEPGSYFHLNMEVFHSTPTKKTGQQYPTSFAIGLGFHF